MFLLYLIWRALSTQESMASAEGGVNVQPVPLKRASAHTMHTALRHIDEQFR